MNVVPRSLLPGVVDIVQRSGVLICDHYAKPRKIRHKGRIDLVTETDLAVEAFLKEHLKKFLPEAGFLAEESAEKITPQGLCWIIDPLDGTTNFAHSVPLVATSVALWMDGQVVAGIINTPFLGECFYAAKGHGAHCNGEPISVSNTDSIEKALVATGFPYAIEGELDAILRRMQRVMPVTQGLRRCGAAALDLAWLAAGKFDCFYETLLKPWDMAAGWLMVEEAGGRVSHFDGSPQSVTSGEILATNDRLHKAMLELLDIRSGTAF